MAKQIDTVEVYERANGFEGLELSVLNDGGKRVLECVPVIHIKCNLGDYISKLGVTQAELSQITGIRQGTISDLVTKRKSTISIPHILVLMVALKITHFNDFFDITFDDETNARFEKEREEWESTKKIPEDRVNLMVANVINRVK